MGKKKKRKAHAMPTAAKQEVRSFSEYRHVWSVLGLCAFGFLIYSNTFQSTFHFDDLSIIVNNPAIRKLWDIRSILNAFNTRALTGWTFAFNYAFGGLDVFGYHFFNIWLHVCNSVLVYFLGLQFLSIVSGFQKKNDVLNVWTAFSAALIFLAHPLQTQAVNYIWQRTTLLAVFFYLMTLFLYIQARRQDSKLYLGLAMAACFLAMFCKEIAFTLPLMIVVIEFLLIRPVRPKGGALSRVLPFLILLVVIPMMLQRTPDLSLKIMRPHDTMHGVSQEFMPQKDYLLTQVNVVRTYLRLFVLPVHQNIDYDYPLVSRSGILSWIFSAALLITMGGAGWWFFRRYSLVTLSIVWFFLTLAVESLVTSADVIVEHRMYLPMVGLSLGFGVLMKEFVYEKNLKIGLLFGSAVVIALAVLTFQRNDVWENDIKLWGNAIEGSPRKARPLNNRGVEFKKLGFLDLALSDLDHAIVIKPDYPEAYFNRGNLYKMKGQYDLALADLTKAIDLEPHNAEGYSARAYLYRRKDMVEEALKDFDAAITLDPNNAETYNNRAYIYQKTGHKQDAIADYSRAISVQPDYIYAYNNRGNLYLEKGDYTAAIEDYDRAIKLKADFGEAYMNRAIALYGSGQFTKSREDVGKARTFGTMPNPEFVRKLKQALQGQNMLKGS